MLTWLSYRLGPVLAISLLALACMAGRAFAELRWLCPTVAVRGPWDVNLSATETRFVCGDPEASGAWRQIPLPQAKFHLETFLQDRGYFNAQLEEKDGVLVVELGVPTHVSSLTARGAPETLRLERRRKVLGARLTPALLERTEQWVGQELRAMGYPCPEVSSTADPNTGELLILVEPGERLRLVSVATERHPDLAVGIFRRYDAFQIGEFYNGNLLLLTESRILADHAADSARFSVSCHPDGARARQELLLGPPRLLRFGFGTSTEGLLTGRVSWRNTRLGSHASWVNVSAHASAIEQRVSAVLNWYYSPVPSRRSLRPLAEFRHVNEEPFETIAVSGQLFHATSWDSQALGLTVSAGPSLDLIRTLRGGGRRDSQFLSLEAEGRLMSHEFEYYALNNPRSGYGASLRVSLNSDKIFSSVSAQRLYWRGEKLFNYRSYDPPLLIVGIRGGLASTLSDALPGLNEGLPPEFVHFLGGSMDLRGFGRRELPKSGIGALTAAFIALEARLSNQLPARLEPFVFYDLGALGGSFVSFDPPLYHSPGFGIRWQSPIGVFRTTLAHGYQGGKPDHWQFFLNYGEEF